MSQPISTPLISRQSWGHYNKRKQTRSSHEKEPPTDPHDPQRLRPCILGDLFGTCHKQHSGQLNPIKSQGKFIDILICIKRKVLSINARARDSHSKFPKKFQPGSALTWVGFEPKVGVRKLF